MRTTIIGALVGAFVASSVGVVFSQVEGDVINACVNRQGSLRLAMGGCLPSETPISWGQTGPAGPAGAEGPAGPQGAQGEPGVVGASLVTTLPVGIVRVFGSDCGVETDRSENSEIVTLGPGIYRLNPMTFVSLERDTATGIAWGQFIVHRASDDRMLTRYIRTLDGHDLGEGTFDYLHLAESTDIYVEAMVKVTCGVAGIGGNLGIEKIG